MDEIIEPGQRIRRLIKRFEQNDYDYEEMAKIPVEDKETVQALIQGLNAPEWRITLACTRALGNSKVRHELVVDTLTGLLVHQEELVSEEAVRSLGRIGPPAHKAVPSILNLLEMKKENMGLVKDAISTLGLIGKTEETGTTVVPLLIKIITNALETPSDEEAVLKTFTTLRPVQEILSRLFGKPKKKTTAREVFSDIYHIISTTCEALGKLGCNEEEKLQVLSQALAIQDYGVRLAAAKALTNLESVPSPVVESILGLVRRTAEARNEETPAERRQQLLDLIDVLYEFEKMFPEVVMDLVTIPDLPREPNDFSPVLKKFVQPPFFIREDMQKLGEFLTHPEAETRAQAIELIGYLGVEGSFLAPDVLKAVDDPDPEVALRAIEALGRLGVPDENAVQRLRKIVIREDIDEKFRGLVRDSLYRLGSKEPVPAGGIDSDMPLHSYIPLEYNFSSSLHVDNSLFFSFHRIIEHTHPGTWLTNADEFGVVSFEPSSKRLHKYQLPVVFPVQQAGGYGAKREFSLQAKIGHELVFSVKSPYSDDLGWGNDNFVYSFNTESKTWFRWRGQAGDQEFKKDPLEPGKPEPEKHSNSISSGELIAWVGDDDFFHTYTDDTPYHLDNWEYSPATAQALQEKFAAREAMPIPEYRLDISPLCDFLWAVDKEKFGSEEEFAEKTPLYRVYDMKRFILTWDKRLAGSTGLEILPCDCITWDGRKRRYLVMLIRTFYWNSRNMRRRSADAIIVIDAGKAGE